MSRFMRELPSTWAGVFNMCKVAVYTDLKSRKLHHCSQLDSDLQACARTGARIGYCPSKVQASSCLTKCMAALGVHAPPWSHAKMLNASFQVWVCTPMIEQRFTEQRTRPHWKRYYKPVPASTRWVRLRIGLRQSVYILSQLIKVGQIWRQEEKSIHVCRAAA